MTFAQRLAENLLAREMPSPLCSAPRRHLSRDADGSPLARLPRSGREWQVEASSLRSPDLGAGGRSCMRRLLAAARCSLRARMRDNLCRRRDARRAGRRQQRLSQHHPACQPSERCARHGGGLEVRRLRCRRSARRRPAQAGRRHAGLHRQARQCRCRPVLLRGTRAATRLAELSRADRCQARARARSRVRDGEARIRAPPDGDRREGKTTIVILDACRDNPLARNLARSMGTRSTAIGRGLAAASTGLGTFIAYSTQPGNVALDGQGRNSPFTAALSSTWA